MCAVLEFPASTYYAAKKSEQQPSRRKLRDEWLKKQIMRVWDAGRRQSPDRWLSRAWWRSGRGLRRLGVCAADLGRVFASGQAAVPAPDFASVCGGLCAEG